MPGGEAKRKGIAGKCVEETKAGEVQEERVKTRKGNRWEQVLKL